MLEVWEVFRGRPNGVRGVARVTLQRDGALLLNELAFEQIGRPEAVELMFEAGRRRIGLKAIDASEDHAFPVTKLKRMSQWVVRASPFFVHHKIKSDRTMLFGKVEMTADGVMALDMASVVAVRRGSK